MSDSSLLMSCFLQLEGSTTLFLEQLSGKPLRSAVRRQAEDGNGGGTIRREAVLYFDTADLPVIFSRSTLDLGLFSTDEAEGIRKGLVPLGRILDPEGRGLLRKENMTVELVPGSPDALFLSTAAAGCYVKCYDLVAGRRVVGRVREYVNNESLSRAFR